MEPAIIQLYGITHAPLILVNHKLIVEAEFAFRGTREVGTHLDMTINIGAKDSA